MIQNSGSNGKGKSFISVKNEKKPSKDVKIDTQMITKSREEQVTV